MLPSFSFSSFVWQMLSSLLLSLCLVISLHFPFHFPSFIPPLSSPESSLPLQVALLPCVVLPVISLLPSFSSHLLLLSSLYPFLDISSSLPRGLHKWHSFPLSSFPPFLLPSLTSFLSPFSSHSGAHVSPSLAPARRLPQLKANPRQTRALILLIISY